MRQSADWNTLDALLELFGLIAFRKVGGILDKRLRNGIDVYVVSRDFGSNILDVRKLGTAGRAAS
jgi:hypothetical protein